MEETFGTAVPRVFLDLELTYEFNLWFKKNVVPFFPTSKVPRTEKMTPNIDFPKENHRTTSEGTTALF